MADQVGNRRGRKPKVDREQVATLLRAEWSQSEIARHFNVSPQAIHKIVKAMEEATQVQPVAHDGESDAVELTPPPSFPRPVPLPPPAPPVQARKPDTPLPPGSEWRGVGLGQTLAERRRQLQVMSGPEAALEFARKEAWHLTRAGVSLEAISQQLDMAGDEVAVLVAEARQRALETIDAYDARVSLSAALEDIQVSRRESLRALSSATASQATRAAARRMLLACAQAEADLAVLIESYRHAKGLDAGAEGEGADVRSIDYWVKGRADKGAMR